MIALHDGMDNAIRGRESSRERALASKQTTRYWALLVTSVEYAFIKYFGLKGSAATHMRGRAVVRTTRLSVQPIPK